MGNIVYNLSKSNNLSMYRGDTMNIFVDRSIVPFDPDGELLGISRYIYLGVMEPNQDFEYALIRKAIPYGADEFDSEGNITIKLNPTDTELLAEGLYYYQIKACKEIQNSDTEEVKTIKTGKLVIM